MVVLLAHDVIPHHHHDHNHSESKQVSVYHTHQHIHQDTHCSHAHGGASWNHNHNTTSETCCFLTHNRVQKDVSYQIFLKADIVQYDTNDTQKVQKFRVHNFRLIPEPLRFTPLRRGPPSQHLA